jgi:hypothetical protein
MNQPPSYYTLYCLNSPCINSVFHKNTKIIKVFNAENITASHICPYCQQTLASYMDILIEHALIEAEVKSLSYCR